MKTFMFPGQGSQSRGMGGDLFDEFKKLTEKADKILGYSIKELCLDDPKKELNKTQFTQPALYVVNAFSYFKKIEETGQKPDYLVGHSLGEFNALLAAECFDFETGLKLVKKRGELMSQASDGGMAAILNATKEEIESILEQNGLTGIDLANYNTPSQIVISGLIDEIAKAQPFFQQGTMLYYPLNTSGAFHSRYMQSSKEKFEAYLKKFKFSDLKIPVISNVTAKPYQNDNVIVSLSSQIASTVKWSESIQYLMSLETNSNDAMEFVEVGHGEVLTKLVRTIKQQTSKAAPTSPALNNNDDNKVMANNTVAEPAQEKQILEKSPSNKASEPNLDKPSQQETIENEPINNLIKKLNETPQKLIEAEEKVVDWNNKHPIGTKVKSSIMDYDNLETRTEAIVLFGHRAAVYIKGYNGYFDLDEIAPL